MNRKLQNLLVTGGAGFIGSNFIRFMFKQKDFNGKIVNLDKLTYCGRRENLLDIEKNYGDRYIFYQGDINDRSLTEKIFKTHDIDTVIHFAAESHVDRSITGPSDFITTNIYGTFNLLETARQLWKNPQGRIFHHISTDEVYGSLGEHGYFLETTPYSPRSPYAASKAAADHLVSSYAHTYNLPTVISNSSNNYGPYQYTEKLIPLIIKNIFENKALPVYGDGKNIRDWLYVDDHSRAVLTILKNGQTGESYNIGGENEWENIKLVNVLCEKAAIFTGKSLDTYKHLITFVKDRPGHDQRYAINCNKIKQELGWQPSVGFEEGLNLTVKWYFKHIL